MAAGELSPGRRPRLHLRGVPVLTYHGVAAVAARTSNRRADKYLLAEAIFREQLALLAREGFRPALLGELWTRPGSLPDAGSRAILTFDDGLVSQYEVAYPALAERGMRADFFVNTATIGQPGFLSSREIAEMQAGGMSFQSHGHDHVVLLGLSDQSLDRQLRDSKRRLEDRLGTAVDFFAAPYGFVSRRIILAARRAGYRAVCTSREWLARPGSPVVSRIAVHSWTTPADLLGLLRGRPLPYARRLARAALVYLPQRALLRLQPARLGVQVLERPHDDAPAELLLEGLQHHELLAVEHVRDARVHVHEEALLAE